VLTNRNKEEDDSLKKRNKEKDDKMCAFMSNRQPCKKQKKG
jgi:hypothetical protein